MTRKGFTLELYRGQLRAWLDDTRNPNEVSHGARATSSAVATLGNCLVSAFTIPQRSTANAPRSSRRTFNIRPGSTTPTATIRAARIDTARVQPSGPIVSLSSPRPRFASQVVPESPEL